MAQDATLSGLRNQIITSLFGRRLGFTAGNSSDVSVEYLAGVRGVREQVEGWSAAGSTIVSTSVATQLSPYGVSVVGATGASGTTGYVLSAPVPGVEKRIFCPTSGYAVITLASGNFITTVSTGSNGSTHTIITFAGKGNAVTLLGVSTAYYAVMPNQTVSSVTTGQVSFS